MTRPTFACKRLSHSVVVAGAVAATLLCLDAGDGVGTAQAQQLQQRTQTRIQSNAVSRTLRTAMRPKLEVKNSAGPVTAEAVDKDGKYLAVASGDNVVRDYDLDDGKAVRR